MTGALLGFVPFIVFALVEKALGTLPGLACGALASVVLLLRDRHRGERELNLLEAGSALMFAGLTALALWRQGPAWSVWEVRLWVDGGLLLIVLASMAAGRPFTLAHARRQVSPEVARSARFLRNNQVVSCAWAVAIALLAAADTLMVLRPATPAVLGVALSLAALGGAAAFTSRFARRIAAQAKANLAFANSGT